MKFWIIFPLLVSGSRLSKLSFESGQAELEKEEIANHVIAFCKYFCDNNNFEFNCSFQPNSDSCLRRCFVSMGKLFEN